VASRQGPLIRYFGSKYRRFKRYPAPKYRTIIEPFAGGAGYALNYLDHEVILLEADIGLVQMWDYVISSSYQDIITLPDIEEGVSLERYQGKIPDGALHLMRMWASGGSQANPHWVPGRWNTEQPQYSWNHLGRPRAAAISDCIKHWRVYHTLDYTPDIDVHATWFIDPPYENIVAPYAPKHEIDYKRLGAWCRSRKGQVIVCEMSDATWLPFQPMPTYRNTGARHVFSKVTVAEGIFVQENK